MLVRRLARAVAALAAVPLLLSAPPATAAVRDPSSHDLLAVVGTDGQLWTGWSDEGTWQPRGGSLVTAPALVRAGSTQWAFGVGTDGNVWVRDLAAGTWQRFGIRITECRAVAAALSHSTLLVACKGTDGALWYARTPVTGSALPAMAATDSWRKLGGRLLYDGLGVQDAGTASDPAFRFMVVGADGRVWTNRLTGWLSDGWIAREAYCEGGLGLSGGGERAACQGARNAVTSFADPDGTRIDSSGISVGRAAVGIGADGSSTVYVLGTDGHVWASDVASGGTGYVPFVQRPGAGRHGIAALTYPTG